MLVDYPPPAADLSEVGKYLSLGLTLAVHLLLFAFLFFGIRWTTQVNEAIEVELVRAVPQPDVVPVVPEARKTPARPVESPPPPPVSKPAAPLPKPDIALKEEKKEKPRPPAATPVPPQVDSMMLEQELSRARLDRQKAEAAKADASAIAAELAALDSKKQAMEQARMANSKAMADYIGRIRSRIKSNIVLPPDIKGNPEAIFDVVQFPSGEILNVHLKKSSGHAGYDAAVERAIRKSSPLPKPERGDLFARNLELRFHPLED
ncbi:cell envelope integrity protein TolA [Sterolibacterium denitrificans]|uniref:cell envelope integrity protein TolA n=1 Tax=Sterolibacterium denitrificans TaxID=157592 RepID=UPI001561CBEC|nr:cell envelope integrity protein TolA [Sterolibacterium denitrificans]